MRRFIAELTEQGDKENTKPLNVALENVNGSLLIAPEGYGDSVSSEGNGTPVLLEVYEGKLRLVVWSDINQEDPTHIIELSGAKESKYRG